MHVYMLIYMYISSDVFLISILQLLDVQTEMEVHHCTKFVEENAN